MLTVAGLGIGFWLLRDHPVLLFIVLFFSPTFILTHQFLDKRADRCRRPSWTGRVKIWLLVTSVVVPLQIMLWIAAICVIELMTVLAGWLTGRSFW